MTTVNQGFRNINLNKIMYEAQYFSKYLLRITNNPSWHFKYLYEFSKAFIIWGISFSYREKEILHALF